MDALRDKFICGLYNETIQKRLLSEGDIGFEEACKKALSFELASNESRNIHEAEAATTSASVAAVCTSSRNKGRKFKNTSSSFRYGKSNQSSLCYRCGKNHKAAVCPAASWKCFKCRRTGHVAAMCRQMKQSVKAVGDEVDDLENSYESSGEDLLDNVNLIAYDKVRANKFCMPNLKINREIGTVKSVKGRKISPLVIKVKINSVPVEVEVDTGACESIMPEKMFKNYFGYRTLEPADKLKSVTGDVIEVVGRVNVMVEYGDRSYDLQLYVVKNDYFASKPLMGRTWLSKIFPRWKSFFDMKSTESAIKLVKSGKLVDEIKKQFADVFSTNRSSISSIKNFKATVVLKENVTPIFCKAYPVPYAMCSKVEAEINRLEQTGVIIRVATSRWASPLVVVAKKDGSIRLCVDLKVTLNRVIDMHHYPLPSIEDILVSLSGAEFFCVLDLAGAFTQLEIAEESTELFTVNTHLGLFRFVRLPFGLKTAPCIFQSVLDNILRGLDAKCYIDDVIVKGKTIEECSRNLKNVLKRLSEYNVRVNLGKCKFFERKVEYLGHVISGAGIEPSPTKVEAIKNAATSVTVTQLKSYLGLVNFYRKFVPMQASILSPLYHLTKKGVEFRWDMKCQNAFETSKRLISQKILLAHYNTSDPITLSCDASQEGVGAVLSTVVNGSEVPISFASATLSDAERNYSQTEKEALAIVFAVRKFHKFLFGRKFVLLTDHLPLKTIFSPEKGVTVTATSRLQRWSIILSAYDYNIRYKRGVDMYLPDAMSRLPQRNIKTGELSESLVNSFSYNDHLPISFKDIAQLTAKDVVLCKVLESVKQGWSNNIEDPNLKPYFLIRNSLSIEQGCLMWGIRVIVPSALRGTILKIIHAEHPGIVKMKLLARSICWWPKIDSDLETLVEECSECQRYRRNNSFPSFSGWPKVEVSWKRIHADFFHFMGQTFLLIIDAASKWIELSLMSRTDADAVIKELERIFASWGLPEQWVSDNGPPFGSAKLINFLKSNGVSVLKSPVYCPQANGIAERAVQTIKQNFKKAFSIGVHYSKDDIIKHINNFTFSYRNSPCPVSGKCPSELMLRYQPRTILRQIRPLLTGGNSSPIHDGAIHQPQRIFAAGDIVWFRYKNQWERAKVIDSLSNSRYLIEYDGNIKHVHQSQLRPATLAQNTVAQSALPVNRDLQEQPVNPEINELPYQGSEETSTNVEQSDKDDDKENHKLSLRRSTRARRPPGRFHY